LYPGYTYVVNTFVLRENLQKGDISFPFVLCNGQENEARKTGTSALNCALATADMFLFAKTLDISTKFPKI
jgi:hypothetical protein